MKGNLLFLVLVFLSILFYSIHFIIFGDAARTVSGIILSLAYVPLGITYQILVLDKIMEVREKLQTMKKMNIILGSFYHEMGNDILKIIVAADENSKTLEVFSRISASWESSDFDKLSESLADYKCSLNIEVMELDKLDAILENESKFLLSLITNPILEEYEDFTNMIISLLHIRDEIQGRYREKDIGDYEKYYLKHDICYMYKYLLLQWIDYIKHLKEVYPALYVKALINSPFNNKTMGNKDVEYLDINKM